MTVFVVMESSLIAAPSIVSPSRVASVEEHTFTGVQRMHGNVIVLIDLVIADILWETA